MCSLWYIVCCLWRVVWCVLCCVGHVSCVVGWMVCVVYCICRRVLLFAVDLWLRGLWCVFLDMSYVVCGCVVYGVMCVCCVVCCMLYDGWCVSCVGVLVGGWCIRVGACAVVCVMWIVVCDVCCVVFGVCCSLCPVCGWCVLWDMC